MRKRCLSMLIICIFISIFLSGCWDKVEIDQRGFVEVMIVDPAPSEYEQKAYESEKNTPGMEKQRSPMLKVTYVFPNTSLLTGEGGGGGNEPGFTTISSIASGISKANRYVDARLSRRLYFGQTQIVIFGEKLFENPEEVKQVIDHFRRDPELSRTIKVLIAEGEGSKVAEVKPKSEKLLFRYIRGILDNERTNGRIIDINMNEFVTALSKTENTTMLPKMSVKDDEIKISGVAFVKNYKLAGYLSEYDTLYFNTLRGTRKGGRENINVGDLTVEYATNNTSRSIKLLNGDPDNIEVGINVRIEGTVVGGEYDKELFDDETIKRIEKSLDSMSDESCSSVIKKLQKDLNVDALLIGDYLKKFHPSLWDKVKDRWDEVYPNIKITPVISNKVRRIGNVK